MKKYSLWLLAVALLTLAPLSLLAQSSRGVITGVIQDPTGAVVANVQVTLKSPSQGTTTVVKTNSAGIYRFDGVDVGDYVVSATSTGFETSEVPATVNVGSTVGRDFHLVVGKSTDTIEVSSTALELQTEDAVRGSTISSQELAELPIAGQNSLNLLLTNPGAVRSNLGGSLDSGIGAVNGARARSNNFLLDGIQNNDISVAGPALVIANNDELSEVNFQTSNFSPEFGRAGGAVTSQITKSGTNSIHGTIAEVYRSQLLNATTQTQRNAYTSALATYNSAIAAGNPNFPVPVVKNKFHENIPAFTIGGPVLIPHIYNGRDRTFFFAGGQWDRFSSNSLTTFSGVPTAASVATLQALAPTCPNVALYLNLLNLAGNPTGSAVGLSVQTLSLALPASLAATSCGGGTRTGQTITVGQYYRPAKDVYLNYNNLVRIDHKASNKQDLMFRFIFDNTSDNLGGTTGLGPAFDVPYTGRTIGAAFNDVYQVRNNVVNEFRFGFVRTNFQFNIPPANTLALTLPQYGITSVAVPGVSSSFNQGRVANTFEYEDAITIVKGRHAFKFGADITRQLAVQVAPFNGRGTVAFSNITAAQSAVTTACPTCYATAVSAIANFIDNYAGVNAAPVNILYDVTNPASPGKYRPNIFAQSYFVQDTFKFNPDLTIVYGMRYENFGQPANGTFTSPAFVGYGTNDYLSTAKVKKDNNNFGPTFGFSYNPHVGGGMLNGRTVIRGGFQVTYDTFYNNLLSNIKGASPNSAANIAASSAISTTTLRGIQNPIGQLATAFPFLSPYTTQSSVFSQNIKNPYYYHMSLGVQEELPGHVVLDMSYVGSLGRQLFFTNPINPAIPNATFTQVATQSVLINGVATTVNTRVFPNRGTIQIRDSGLTSNYHSFQAQLRHHGLQTFAGRIYFSTSYTWSKNLDVLSETFATNSSGQNPSRSPVLAGPLGYLDYGPSDNDRRHVSSTVINFAIRGPKHGFFERLAGGWSVAPILTVQSGTPYTVLNGTDRDLDGSSLGDRPNIGDPSLPVNTRALVVGTSTCATGYLEGNAYANSGGTTINCITPSQAHFVQVTTYSPSSPAIEGRNSNYTTRYLNLDTNILKKIAITERFKVELRGEFFNVTNNQNFDTPASAGNRDLTAGGTATSFLNTNVLNGGSRNFRVGGKILF